MPLKPNPTDRPWRQWYQLNIWRRRRLLQLRHEPLCAFCIERGVVTPATIADHIVPHRGNWTAFRLGPLQSLCNDCHVRLKHRLDLHGYSSDIGDDGWPVDPRHPANGGNREQTNIRGNREQTSTRNREQTPGIGTGSKQTPGTASGANKHPVATHREQFTREQTNIRWSPVG
jgi:hypothetical protein